MRLNLGPWSMDRACVLPGEGGESEEQGRDGLQLCSSSAQHISLLYLLLGPRNSFSFGLVPPWPVVMDVCLPFQFALTKHIVHLCYPWKILNAFILQS
jgi:hypothetical protein